MKKTKIFLTASVFCLMLGLSPAVRADGGAEPQKDGDTPIANRTSAASGQSESSALIQMLAKDIFIKLFGGLPL